MFNLLYIQFVPIYAHPDMLCIAKTMKFQIHYSEKMGKNSTNLTKNNNNNSNGNNKKKQ